MIKLYIKTIQKNPEGGQKGFTLVDILVGLAIASVVLAAVVSLFTTMGRSYTTQNVAADVQQITRAGIELMIQEIRMAGFDPIGTAAPAIVDNFDDSSVFDAVHSGQVAATDATQIAFTMDSDMDGRIDNCRVADGSAVCPVADDNIANELIAYRLNNGVLEKYRGERNPSQWEEFTENNVSNLTFRYFDSANNPTTDSSLIASVEISLSIQEPAGRGRMISRTYRTRVRCRNIGL